MKKLFFLSLTIFMIMSCVNSNKNLSEKSSNDSDLVEDVATDSLVEDKIEFPKVVLGKWKAQNKFLEEMYFTIEVYEQNGEWFAERVFFDGSGDVEQLKKDGDKYIIIDNEFHESYVIKSGDLQLWGEHGLMADYTITKE